MKAGRLDFNWGLGEGSPEEEKDELARQRAGQRWDLQEKGNYMQRTQHVQKP